MTTVYLLWHVHETVPDHEDQKFIGAYSTEDKAKEAVARLTTQPGFKDYPDDFQIHPYVLDETDWQEGFITVAESFRSMTDRDAT